MSSYKDSTWDILLFIRKVQKSVQSTFVRENLLVFNQYIELIGNCPVSFLSRDTLLTEAFTFQLRAIPETRTTLLARNKRSASRVSRVMKPEFSGRYSN